MSGNGIMSLSSVVVNDEGDDDDDIFVVSLVQMIGGGSVQMKNVRWNSMKVSSPIFSLPSSPIVSSLSISASFFHWN
jgi:hypothetical protein